MTLTFATWNVGTAFGRPVPPDRLEHQIGFLRALAPDVLALQEVVPANYLALTHDLLGAAGPYRYAVHSSVDAVRRRTSAYAILSRYELSRLRPIEGFLPSGRAIVVDVGRGGDVLTAASVWIPLGQRDRERNPEGPERKLAKLRRSWQPGLLRKETARRSVSMRTPRELTILTSTGTSTSAIPNVRDQGEALLHDPHRGAHQLRDAYRVFLERSPAERNRALDHFRVIARAQGGEGCLATSHVVQKQQRRFDFIYVSPDLTPTSVHYREEALGYRWRDAPPSALGLSDHALVSAALVSRHTDAGQGQRSVTLVARQ